MTRVIILVILLALAGCLIFFSFQLFRTSPSLGYLFHLYSAAAILITGTVIYAVNRNRYSKITWLAPILSSLLIAFITVAINSDIIMVTGQALTVLGMVCCFVAILLTLIKKAAN